MFQPVSSFADEGAAVRGQHPISAAERISSA
jgi:hypothetical protein